MITKIKTMLYGFIKYRNLLNELVVRDIKVRYRRSFLGVLWTLLNPLLMMGVITFVFATIFESDIPNFPVYFLIGNILFQFNSEATNQALFSILSNGGLIKKVYIPKYLFPLSKVLSSLVNLFFAFIALIVVMVYTEAPFHPTMFLVVVPIFYLILFSTGLSLILSALNVFFRDLTHLYSVITLAWMYFTPIFYPISILKDKKDLLNLNPMYHYITYMRQLILEGTIPSLQENIVCFSIGMMTLIIGLWIFYKKQDKFILYI